MTFTRDDFSDMPPEWVAKMLKAAPCTLLPNGYIRTCPVRLSFFNAFELPPKRGSIEPKWGGNLLFPAGADLSLLHAKVKELETLKWPNAHSTDPRKRVKLHSPFKDGADMLKYDGYHEGQTFITASSQNKCPVVERPRVKGAAPEIITDKDRVYPGVWAICTINLYSYDKEKKGVAFGLQSTMLLADDQPFGAGSPTVKDEYDDLDLGLGFDDDDLAL